MSEPADKKFDKPRAQATHVREVRAREARHNPSFFGPIVLIAVGVYFLLWNLGLAPTLNWWAAARLWPLLLIFLGVNVIVQQAPRPLGGLLSALVGLAAVGVLGVALLGNVENVPLLRGLGEAPPRVEAQTETIAFPAAGVEEATIDLDFGSPPVRVSALEDSSDLIAGTVSYRGELNFRTRLENGRAAITLDAAGGSGLFWLDPRNWAQAEELAPWQIGLNRRIPLRLTMDVGSGSADLNLRTLQLNELKLDGGSGSVTLALPDGDYDITYDAGSGATRLNLSEGGRQRIEIKGGSGSLTLTLPRSMEARVEVQSGSGSFRLPERFTQIRGDKPDEGVWVTPDFDDAPNRVELQVNVGSGSVRIEE